MRSVRHLVSVLCLVGAFMVISNNSVASAQQQDTVIRCRFETSSINIGDETILYLEVIDVSDLFAFELEVTFNPEYVEVYGEYPEDDKMILGDFLSADLEESNVIHSGYGAIFMEISQNDPTPPQSGSGVLARSYVSGKQAGVVDFVFEVLILMDPDSEEISYRQENCSLIIEAGEQVTETPTSTFTQTQPTPVDTLTPEPTLTSSPTESAQPSLSPTPQPSDTAAISPTPQISETPTASPIPFPSDIPTIGFSPTPLPSLVISTDTPYPSDTPTVTVTPTATATEIPEPTPRPFNSVYVVLCLTFCLAMFAGIAVLAGVLWYINQSK